MPGNILTKKINVKRVEHGTDRLTDK